MFPFFDIGALILKTLPASLFDPEHAFLFWIVVVLVFLQYRRLAATEEALFGLPKTAPVRETVHSIVFGILGGFVGSLLMALIGVAFSLESGELMYIWAVAIILALINPRLMCFSYAGGIVGLSHLFFGWPQISVAQVAALVAVLHIVESLLIWLHGSTGASPVVIKNRSGETVGGFSVQRFWPVPFTLLILLPVTDQSLVQGSVAMPGWWPLLKLDPDLGAGANTVFAIFPVVAGLGYGDLAITMPPERKSLRTSVNLALFSITLLALAVLASRYPLLAWAAALFSPVGHELVARLGSRGELRGDPYYDPPIDGVRVLDVYPESAAEAAGIQPGSIILEVDGTRVNDRISFRRALEMAPTYVHLTYTSDLDTVTRRLERNADHEAALGLVLVPNPGDAGAMMLESREGWLFRLWQSFRKD